MERHLFKRFVSKAPSLVLGFVGTEALHWILVVL